MARLACYPLLLGLLYACCSPAPDVLGVHAEDLIDNYGDFVGHIGWLTLREEGEYDCFVTNGSFDGCLTVVGSGSSRGKWKLEDGLITFTPTFESSRLVLSFVGASAVPASTGLDLYVEEFEYALERGTGYFGTGQEPGEQ